MSARPVLSLSTLLLALAACGSPQSTLGPAGPAAGLIAHLGWVVYITFGIVTVVTLTILLVAVLRRRGSLDWHEPWNVSGGQHWILIGGLAIPFVVLGGIFIMTLIGQRAFPIKTVERSRQRSR